MQTYSLSWDGHPTGTLRSRQTHGPGWPDVSRRTRRPLRQRERSCEEDLQEADVSLEIRRWRRYSQEIQNRLFLLLDLCCQESPEERGMLVVEQIQSVSEMILHQIKTSPSSCFSLIHLNLLSSFSRGPSDHLRSIRRT